MSFRKLQIVISQTTDFHLANYRFSLGKLQIFIWQTTDSHFANYRFSFRKLQISNQTILFSRFWHSLHLFISPSIFFAFFFYCNIFHKTRPVATCSHRLPFIFNEIRKQSHTNLCKGKFIGSLEGIHRFPKEKS